MAKPPVYLDDTNVGFTVGTDLPVITNSDLPIDHEDYVEFSTVLNQTFDKNEGKLLAASIVVKIPLDVTDGSIIWPVTEDGEKTEINVAQIGLDKGEILSDWDQTSLYYTQGFITIAAVDAGFLHLKLPVAIAKKIEQGN